MFNLHTLNKLGNWSVVDMLCCTQSVLHAPATGEELALAVANRSAAFFHLHDYEVHIQRNKNQLKLPVLWVCPEGQLALVSRS